MDETICFNYTVENKVFEVESTIHFKNQNKLFTSRFDHTHISSIQLHMNGGAIPIDMIRDSYYEELKEATWSAYEGITHDSKCEEALKN